MIKAIGRDVVNLPSRQNLLGRRRCGIDSGGAPFDSTTNATLAGPTLNKVFAPGAVMGESYTLFPIAAAVYAVGRIKNQLKVSHTGSDLIQSLAIAEILTQSLKYSVRRERPDGSGPNSFPSGHAADTMAFATSLERHFDWRFWLPAYTFASYEAMSRLHDNVHYLSDVVAASAVGIIAGRTVNAPRADKLSC
jgi:membrane-associated phospholipid phosphatase